MKRVIMLISTIIVVVSCCLLSCDTQTEKRPESVGKKTETDLPWYKTTYRWAQTNFTEDDPVKADLEFWRKQWRRTKIQGVIVNAGGIVAYYPSKFGLQYRAKYLGEQDFFKRVNDMAHEEGIVVVARMDINRATKEFYEAHPDWFCRRKNGEPIMSNDRYFSCINSDYYKVFIPQVLEEIIERYHPVGFTDNSWKGLERNTICYCDNCKSKFRAERGMELPEAGTTLFIANGCAGVTNAGWQTGICLMKLLKKPVARIVYGLVWYTLIRLREVLPT